jgi:ectoine hydroxylase-related dioxygenase (phytanoyl-CoA dioxygenase family)
MLDEFHEEGFTTKPFPQDLTNEMLSHIHSRIEELSAPYSKSKTDSLKQLAMSIPDDVWAQKMHRGYRMFPKALANKIYQWADQSIRKPFGRTRSVINCVTPFEVSINPELSEDSMIIYWRCVRPGKPDAGRPHRDATFWVLELEEGYDPKVPFAFDYLKDCIKVWIPLLGCTPKTTLQIIPRSHQAEIPIAIDDTEYGRRPTIADSWLKEHEKDFMSPKVLSQGSCIIFDMNLVHRGPTHQETELRISAEFPFIIQ